MKKYACFTLFLISFYVFSLNVFGCSFIETDIVLSKEEIKKYYLEEFKGAIFIGEVLSVKKTTVKWFNENTIMNEVEIEVEKYWTGVDKSEITIYTGVGPGDCGTEFKIGKKYYLNLNKVGGLLWATFDNTSEVHSVEKAIATKPLLNEIFGKPKGFNSTNQ